MWLIYRNQLYCRNGSSEWLWVLNQEITQSLCFWNWNYWNLLISTNTCLHRYNIARIPDVFFYCFKRIQDFHYYATRSSSGSHAMQVNILRPRQNGRRFADDTFKCIFLNKTVRILIKISLKFVPKGPINNNPTLVQIMAWRWSGDKPLSDPMMVSLLTHICVTRPQWVKTALGKTGISYIGPIIWNKVLSVALILTPQNVCFESLSKRVSKLIYSKSIMSIFSMC